MRKNCQAIRSHGGQTGSVTTGRDRLRELLDAILDEDNETLEDMAADAFASPFHFTRQVSRDVGESPVALRRRVLLERAAWQLGGGASVTDTAFAAGYGSVEGFSRAFSRAFGHPPSAARRALDRTGHWLRASNGVHFHPPAALWVEDSPRGRSDMDPTALMLRHDLDDTRELLVLAGTLDEDEYRRVREPGLTVLSWDGPEESIAAVLDRLVWSKEVWLASIEGEDMPQQGGDEPAELLRRLDVVASRWLGTVREIDRRGAWGDTVIDALCEPPESFVVGSIVAHVLTYAAHRRQLARHWLRAVAPGGATTAGHGDPIEWLQRGG
ncbi:helix-turn-helix domain-containing protein [Stackebrandtia soli]|uniref:helix-turn-helix domain-containing protein n=1 Tax=Stackebrandtia soli TaxID=1892856 RepID=UPI0039EBDB91